MGRCSALRLVPGVDPTCAVEGKFLEAGAAMGFKRVEEEADVVAEVVAGEDGAGETVVALVQDRDAAGALMPLALGKLVDLVAGLAAEQLGEVLGAVGNEVEGDRVGRASDPAGAVLLGEADEEARRIDAALAGEADEAAGDLAAGARRGDEHRVVEAPDEFVERLRGR